jgi:hypothetical protein
MDAHPDHFDVATALNGIRKCSIVGSRTSNWNRVIDMFRCTAAMSCRGVFVEMDGAGAKRNVASKDQDGSNYLLHDCRTGSQLDARTTKQPTDCILQTTER